MDERQVAWLIEQHIDDDALGRGDEQLVDVLLALVVPAVGTDELHASAGQRHVEHASVSGVRQEEADDLPATRCQRKVSVTGDEHDVAEPTHGHVGRLGRTERRDLSVLDEHVVEGEQDFAIDRRPVVGIGGTTRMFPYRPNSWP